MSPVQIHFGKISESKPYVPGSKKVVLGCFDEEGEFNVDAFQAETNALVGRRGLFPNVKYHFVDMDPIPISVRAGLVLSCTTVEEITVPAKVAMRKATVANQNEWKDCKGLLMTDTPDGPVQAGKGAILIKGVHPIKGDVMVELEAKGNPIVKVSEYSFSYTPLFKDEGAFTKSEA